MGDYNTIDPGADDSQGKTDIWGGVGGFNHFVFRQGTGQVTIEDFDHHAGSAFSHAQGDVIDLRDYHMSGFNEVWQHVTVNANGDAVIKPTRRTSRQPGHIDRRASLPTRP